MNITCSSPEFLCLRAEFGDRYIDLFCHDVENVHIIKTEKRYVNAVYNI